LFDLFYFKTLSKGLNEKSVTAEISGFNMQNILNIYNYIAKKLYYTHLVYASNSFELCVFKTLPGIICK
jgi:hypothetical protein